MKTTKRISDIVETCRYNTGRWHDMIAVGNITVQCKIAYDDDQQLDWLGEYISDSDALAGERTYRTYGGSMAVKQFAYVYSCDTGAVWRVGDWDGHRNRRLWRDEKGRIVPEPNYGGWSREYRFIGLNNGQESAKQARRDARRLEQYNEGYLCDYGVCCRVLYDGVEIGGGSVWGIASDSDISEFAGTLRDVLYDAVSQARQFLGKVRGTSCAA